MSAHAVFHAEITQSAFGLRLQAAIATLSMRNRISRRDEVECCEQLFSPRISTGTVEAVLTHAREALSEPHTDLLERGAKVRSWRLPLESGRDVVVQAVGGSSPLAHPS